MRGDPNVEALSYKQASRSASEPLLLSLDTPKTPCGQRVILREAEKKRRSRFAARTKLRIACSPIPSPSSNITAERCRHKAADCRGRLSALGCAKTGKPDQLARAHYGKDIAGVVCNFINDPIWLDDKLSESDEVGEVLFKRVFRNGRAGKREVRKVGYGVVNLKEPLGGRCDIAL